jgi:hypothetical protein
LSASDNDEETRVSPDLFRPGSQKKLTSLYQLPPLQARVPLLADDDVVMDGNAQWLCHVDDRLRHRNVGARRRWIAGRMIVHQPIVRVTAFIRTNRGRGLGAVTVSDFSSSRCVTLLLGRSILIASGP